MGAYDEIVHAVAGDLSSIKDPDGSMVYTLKPKLNALNLGGVDGDAVVENKYKESDKKTVSVNVTGSSNGVDGLHLLIPGNKLSIQRFWSQGGEAMSFVLIRDRMEDSDPTIPPPPPPPPGENDKMLDILMWVIIAVAVGVAAWYIWTVYHS